MKARGVDGGQIHFIGMNDMQQKDIELAMEEAAQSLEGLGWVIPEI